MNRFTLLCLLLAACGDPDVTYGPPAGEPTPKEPVPVAVQQTYSAKGLWTYPNPLSEVPDGAFSRANDAVIRREGIAETRRGFVTTAGTFGASGDRLDALHDFAGTLVGHSTANALLSYSGSAWTAYSGTFAPPTGRKTRFAQIAKSLYFTTSAGVYRLDSTSGTPVAAGVPQALGATVTLTVPAGAGFLPANSQTAYRIVWGTRNGNDRVILGAPSGRSPLINPASGSAKDVTLTVPVPSWVTASHFVQIYRADTSATESIPASDDMALVYEAFPTASEISALSMTVLDITPDELKGASLYSSPNSGVPGSEKFTPPVCSDITEYKQRMWCSATTQRQRVTMTLLSVDAASGGMSDGQGFQVDGTQFTAGAVENTATRTFQRYTAGTAAQNIANTAQSLVRVINAQSSFAIQASYLSGEYDSPGIILLEAKNLGYASFTVIAIGAGTYWYPATFGIMITTDLVRVSNVVTATTSPAHGLRVGQQVTILSGASGFPPGTKTVTSVPSATTFTYSEVGADGSYHGGAIGWSTFTLDPVVTSDPSNAPDGLAYSEYAEPDAVPLTNYLTVGSANYPILRILPLGDTLFIFKEEGIWTLTGDTPETFSVRPFPTPARLLAPQSVVTLGNTIYALTDQGVLAITESGATVVSRPIEGDLLPLYSGTAAMQTTLKNVAFAVPYETERELHLWLPSTSSDTYATQAYVWNYATRAWTRWTKAATTGYVLPGTDWEYLGKPLANGAFVERKTRTLSDYEDETGQAVVMAVDWQVRTGGDPSGYKLWQKATVMLETPSPASVTMSMDTEISGSAASGTFSTLGLPYITSYVPVDQSRSQTLTVGVSGGEVGKRLAVRGLAVDYTTSGTKLRR